MAEKQVRIRLSEIGAEAAQKAFGKVDTSLKGLASSAIAAGVAYFSAQGIISALKYSVQQAGSAEAAAVKLKTAYGKNISELQKFASARQLVTKFDDDGTAAAMAAISAFTRQEGTVKALTIAAQDLAEAKGMDLVSAAELLAKTFGSETNALKRSGIEVDAAAGSTERLKQITEGVSELFGGQATAAAATYEGQLTQTKNAIDDTAQALGEALTPLLREALPEIKEMANVWTEVATSGSEANEIFKKLKDAAILLAAPMATVSLYTAKLFTGKSKEHLYEYRQEAEKLAGQSMPKTIKEIQNLEAVLRKKGMIDAADATRAYQEQLGRAVKAINEASAAEVRAAKRGVKETTDDNTEAQLKAQDAAKKLKADADSLWESYVVGTMTLKEQRRYWLASENDATNELTRVQARIERLKVENLLIDEQKDKVFALAEAQKNSAASRKQLWNDIIKGAQDGRTDQEKYNDEMDQSAIDEEKTAEMRKRWYKESEQGQKAYKDAVVAGTGQMLGSFSALAGQMKGGAMASKRLAQASAIIDTYAGATKAYAQAGILGFVTSAAIIAAGLANVAMIEKQQFADGGYVRGHGGSRSDMVPAQLSAGEGVLTAATVARIGGEAAIDRLNRGGIGGGGITINFTGPVTDRAFVRDYIVPEVRRAVGRGIA